MSARHDDPVGKLLQELPRHHASPEFTDAVMARLDKDRSARLGLRVHRRWWLAAALAGVAGVWLGSVAWQQHRAREETAERVQMMRDEYRALQRELEDLRTMTHRAQPVLELGGTERVDFVFDLRRHAHERDQARAQPTSHSSR